MIEGISNFVTGLDLLERSIVFALKPLPNRRTERELMAEFDRVRRGLLGALCDMLVTGVRELLGTHLVNPPRMADFAVWAVACGLGGFEAAYARNCQDATDVNLEHDILAQSVEALIGDRGEWHGIATELLREIGPAAQVTNPRVLSDQLRRLAPALRSHGILVSHEPRTAGRREIRIVRVERMTQ